MTAVEEPIKSTAFMLLLLLVLFMVEFSLAADGVVVVVVVEFLQGEEAAAAGISDAATASDAPAPIPPIRVQEFLRADRRLFMMLMLLRRPILPLASFCEGRRVMWRVDDACWPSFSAVEAVVGWCGIASTSAAFPWPWSAVDLRSRCVSRLSSSLYLVFRASLVCRLVIGDHVDSTVWRRDCWSDTWNTGAPPGEWRESNALRSVRGASAAGPRGQK